jgi:nitrite reductase (NADH) small subunit
LFLGGGEGVPSPRRSAQAAMPFIPVATSDEMPPGSRKTVFVGDREVALFNVAGTLYAIENTCPHQGGPLGEGWLEGTVVTCPWHAWCFDLRTGHMTLGEYSCVDTFEVQVDGSVVSIASEPR